jgi:hypothetical protein
VLQLEVGDTAKVVLHNSLPFPVNIEPAGLVPSSTRTPPRAAPGATVTYTWEVPASAGPELGDPGAKLWMYR